MSIPLDVLVKPRTYEEVRADFLREIQREVERAWRKLERERVAFWR